MITESIPGEIHGVVCASFVWCVWVGRVAHHGVHVQQAQGETARMFLQPHAFPSPFSARMCSSIISLLLWIDVPWFCAPLGGCVPARGFLAAGFARVIWHVLARREKRVVCAHGNGSKPKPHGYDAEREIVHASLHKHGCHKAHEPRGGRLTPAAGGYRRTDGAQRHDGGGV